MVKRTAYMLGLLLMTALLWGLPVSLAVGGAGNGSQNATVTVTVSAWVVSPPSPDGGGGGGGTPPPEQGTVETILPNGIAECAEGVIQETTQLTSEDGLFSITIVRGTTCLSADGVPHCPDLTATVNSSPPPPPPCAHIIGLAYDFEPGGATFNPPMKFEFNYDPTDIPRGIAEEDLVLAYYDEKAGKWVNLPSTVDPVTHTLTASVSRFTTFAIIACTPAAFSISNLSIQPAAVQPEEPVTITVSVTNTGCTEDSYTAVLTINGVKEAEKNVTIAACSSQDVSFDVTKEDAGNYRVVIDKVNGSFVVVAPAPPVVVPTNWPLIGGIMAAVVAVALFIFFRVRRRRRYTE